ncbi:MAG: PEP-CTERM sorting domain-containing protein [Telluria sp.]
MKSIFLNTLRAAALATAAFAAAGAANATPIQFDWSAVATQANANVHVGDKVSGTITYDTSGAAKTNGNVWNGSGYQYYSTPSLTTTVTVGSRTETINLYAMIVNDFAMWGGDEVIFRADYSPFGRFEFDLVDSSMTALSSADLPTAIDGALFKTSYFMLGSYPTQFGGKIDSFEAAASGDVPEPASIALFGLALASLTVARRRRMR